MAAVSPSSMDEKSIIKNVDLVMGFLLRDVRAVASAHGVHDALERIAEQNAIVTADTPGADNQNPALAEPATECTRGDETRDAVAVAVVSAHWQANGHAGEVGNDGRKHMESDSHKDDGQRALDDIRLPVTEQPREGIQWSKEAERLNQKRGRRVASELALNVRRDLLEMVVDLEKLKRIYAKRRKGRRKRAKLMRAYEQMREYWSAGGDCTTGGGNQGMKQGELREGSGGDNVGVEEGAGKTGTKKGPERGKMVEERGTAVVNAGKVGEEDEDEEEDEEDDDDDDEEEAEEAKEAEKEVGEQEQQEERARRLFSPVRMVIRYLVAVLPAFARDVQQELLIDCQRCCDVIGWKDADLVGMKRAIPHNPPEVLALLKKEDGIQELVSAPHRLIKGIAISLPFHYHLPHR